MPRPKGIYIQYATFLHGKELQLATMEPHNIKYYEVMVYTNAQNLMSIECRLSTRDKPQNIRFSVTKAHFQYFSKEETIYKPCNNFKQHIKHISPIEGIRLQQKQALDRHVSRECLHEAVLVYEDRRHSVTIAVP